MKSPWDMGRDYAALGNELPSNSAMQAVWGLTGRQAALFSFGFAEGGGYKFPPGFREKAEWIFREPDETLDAIVLQILEHAIGSDEDGSPIFASPRRTH